MAGCVLDICGGRIDGDDRCVVHRHDTDHRGCHVAGVRAVVDDHLDEAVFGDGIVAGVAVENLLQRSFVLVQRGHAGEHEHAGTGIVRRSDDAARQRQVTVSRSPACWFASVIVADTSVVLSRSVMVVSVSAIGIGAPFSVNVVRKVVRTEPPESLGSRSITGALLFTASTWTTAVAVLLLLMPSLTTTSMIRVTFEGSMLPLLNLICCSAVLIVGGRRGARERDDTCARARNGDADWRCSVKGQNVVASAGWSA